MARRRLGQSSDLSPETVVPGLKPEDLQKDMSEDEKTNAALAGGNTYRAVTRNLDRNAGSVKVGDITAAVKRKQAKIAAMRKSRTA